MPKKLLIVDDLAINRRILKEMLRRDYDVLEAALGAEALAILAAEHASVSAVLLDISMPEMDGYEVLRRIRADERLMRLPVIMITGSEDEAARVKSLTLGANDFVMKPYNAEVIKHCLRNNITLCETVAEIDVLQKDRLTGVWNRETFFQKAAQEIEKQPPGTFILGCVDVDGFKVINDQYGSDMGDRVLQSLAGALQNSCKATGGLCGRVYADCFVGLYPAELALSGEIGPQALAAEIFAATGLRPGLSVGRYLVADKSLRVSAMYDRASIARNAVKGRYDTHVAVYDESMRSHIVQEQRIVNDMNAALAERQFEVWFQPQYNHATDAMIGAEALVRWRHPEKGLIPPDAFIPIFEQNGFIYSLDKFVWEEVCRYLRKWIDEGRAPLPVSVNISRYDIFCADILETITGLVRRYDLPRELLRLEITESAFAKSPQHIVDVVKTLIGEGFTVEIDDFGSGYSSLNTLKDVPAQIIKLDMKFLQGSDDSSRGGNIVESIVRMAKWLGMSVIAEGVETLRQANYLRSIGCNYMQGYLYARPMDAVQYETHCRGSEKEERLLTLETVENLDNNAFWDPESMDTLIFNSYVGGACIYEYCRGNIELLRATEKYAQVIGSAGMRVEDALKLNWADHLDAQSRGRVIADLEESVATRKEVTGEYVFLNLPGCPRETYLRSTMRVIAAAGERYLVYCTNENITAQRKAELQERRTAEQLQAIMDNVDLGIIAVIVERGTARYLFANDRYYAMLGYTRAQFEKEVGSPYLTIAPEDRQRAMEETARVNSVGKSAALLYNAVTRDGRRRVFRAAISIANLSGVEEPVQLSIVRDITEETETARREREAAAQVQTMMDDMPGGFMRLRACADGAMRAVYFNGGMTALTGMAQEELAALYAQDAFAGVCPDDVAAVKAAFGKMLADSEAHSARYRLRKGDGGYVWLSVSGRKTADPSGDVYLNLYYTDASAQIQEEETQRALLDNLPGGAGLYTYVNGALSVQYLNKSYWELVGREAKDYTGILPMSAVHPDDLAIVTRDLTAAIEQKRDLLCDIRLRNEKRGYRPVHLVGRIVPRASGGYFIYATFTPLDADALSYQQMLPLLLSAMMESTTDLSFTKDADFRYITASRPFAQMVGQKDEDGVIGKTDYDLFDKPLADKYRRDDEALLQGGKSLIDMVEAIPSADGTPHYSSTSKYILYDGAGKVIGLYGVGRDVTKAALQDSQLKLVNDSIPGGLATYVCTPGDFSPAHIRITYFNDGFCALFGFTREEYAQRAAGDPASMIFREDKHIIDEAWFALMEHDTPIDCLYRAHVKGGSFKWISHRAVVADRQNGKVVINAILQDVTDQRELIERLRISEEENNLAVQLGGNIICRFAIAERTLTISPEVAASYSLPETISGVPYEPVRLGMISPESVDAYVGFFEAILHGSRAASATFRQKYFGGWQWMEARSSTIFAEDGKPVKAVISFYDVTERLERETIYRKWQQSIEDRPPASYTLFRCNLHNDASYVLAEGTLLTFDFETAGSRFNERARAYIRACVFPEDQDRYTAFANADTMLASYYRGKRSDVLEYRELLPDGGTRWLRLTADLVECPSSTEVEAYLLYEDIDRAKRAELQTQALSQTDPLTGLLNRATFTARVEALLRAAKPEKRHALFMLDVDGFKQVNDVFGHGAGDQALIDIANALRAVMRRDDLVARLGGDEFVVFLNDVLDDTSAMTKAKQIRTLMRRAFSLEVQISGSIGIALAPRDGMDFETLYKKADCALYYVKGSGKDGCAFYGEDMADEHLQPEPDVAGDLAGKPAEKKRRMLIVDDSRIDYAMLQNIFKEEFIVEKAKDGSAALIRLRHYGSAISVVLLDLMMPGMDGFAVLQKMQESAELRAIPVLIVSGDESREACLKAIRRGATDFITKPVDAELLRVRVQSAVSKAENERLRAKNCLLEVQNEARLRYESVLEDTGLTFIEYNWLTGAFKYYPTISEYLLGTYDARGLWQILLSDMAADAATVQDMQQLVHRVAEDRTQAGGSRIVRLKTPQNVLHTFRMCVRKLMDEYQLTNRLIISLLDLEYDMPK